MTEFHNGYRAYELKILQQMDPPHTADAFHFDTEVIIKLHHQRMKIAEVPIPTCRVDGLKYASNVLRAVRHYS